MEDLAESDETGHADWPARISSGFFIPSFVGSGLTAGGALPALVQGESDSVLDILWNKARTEVGQ